jgi:hypothetical protein
LELLVVLIGFFVSYRRFQLQNFENID